MSDRTNRSTNGPPMRLIRVVPMAASLAVALQLEVVPALGPSPAAGQVVVPSCREAAPGESIQDPEFYSGELLAVWRVNPDIRRSDGTVLKHGKLIVAPVDPATGDFLMSQKEVVPGAKPVHQGAVEDATVNGPEWALSQRGPEILYSCYSKDEQTSRLCKVSRDGQGRWTRKLVLPSSTRKTLRQPSKNPADPVPFIYFERIEGTAATGLSGVGHGWREERRNPKDVQMPEDSGLGKWTPDSSQIVHQIRVEQGGQRITQLALYDVATRVNTVLFFDGIDRDDPFPWSAPELGGAIAIAALVEEPNGGLNVEVYRQDSLGNWVTWSVIGAHRPRLSHQLQRGSLRLPGSVIPFHRVVRAGLPHRETGNAQHRLGRQRRSHARR